MDYQYPLSAFYLKAKLKIADNTSESEGQCVDKTRTGDVKRASKKSTLADRWGEILNYTGQKKEYENKRHC